MVYVFAVSLTTSAADWAKLASLCCISHGHETSKVERFLLWPSEGSKVGCAVEQLFLL